MEYENYSTGSLFHWDPSNPICRKTGGLFVIDETENFGIDIWHLPLYNGNYLEVIHGNDIR